MNRAEQRRRAREEAKARRNPLPPPQPRRDSLMDSSILGVGMSPHFATRDYGLPETASRQWVVDNSDPDEWLGEVLICESPRSLDR